jgi:hypothetical protein
MLRVSAEISSTDVDLQLVNGEAGDSSNVDYSNELMSFATAVASRDEGELAERRRDLLDASNAAVLVDAAAVAGNFQRMVRIADATGIPIDSDRLPMMQGAVDQLELRRFKTAENTPL